ncbi:MAG: hypothetical protein N2117_05555 [Anaerolineales bacterium]|nr:hypothetical protein [Anaerolineales bacterium]MCX7754697.1 hypothetical protein [Anaerolineales bacterium]MDW8278896.1 hypothetical protein [Anaerolineales bacterium]
MPLLPALPFSVTIDQVLLGQGANPAVIRTRRPRLLSAAERALAEGLSLLTPRALYRQLRVEAIHHERIVLEGGYTLSGMLVTRQLAGAESVVVLLCTVGDDIEKQSQHYLESDPLHSLALYGVGSAAAEALSIAACRYFSEQAHREGQMTTIPLSPGLEGWPVGRGQPEIFQILDGAEIGVELLSSGVMRPVKSVSLVLGIGKQFDPSARMCDLCARRESCTFQSHDA